MKRFTLLFEQVKRLAPSTSLDTIRNEMQSELITIGSKNLRNQLALEAEVLDELRIEEQKYKKISAKCTQSIIERSREGFNIGGFFWYHQQDKLNERKTYEERKEESEKMDWLKARQLVAPEVLAKENIDETLFGEGLKNGF